MGALPWARWPWQRCAARQPVPEAPRLRCDLRRRHDGSHVAERGMYLIVWPNDSWSEMPHVEPIGGAP